MKGGLVVTVALVGIAAALGLALGLQSRNERAAAVASYESVRETLFAIAEDASCHFSDDLTTLTCLEKPKCGVTDASYKIVAEWSARADGECYPEDMPGAPL